MPRTELCGKWFHFFTSLPAHIHLKSVISTLYSRKSQKTVFNYLALPARPRFFSGSAEAVAVAAGVSVAAVAAAVAAVSGFAAVSSTADFSEAVASSEF